MQGRTQIYGLGTAVPERSQIQRETLEHACSVFREGNKEKDVYKTLYRLSHVEKRHSVLLGSTEKPLPLSNFYPADIADRPSTAQRMLRYREEAAGLAIPATKRALDNSGLSNNEISHLITISCTGFHAPGLDIQLMKTLDLNPTTQRTHIGFMGCHAAINGIRTLTNIINSEPAARVLLCSLELCSLHFSYQNRTDHIVSNALFSDGSAALVAGESSERHGWRCLGTASLLLPDSEELMSWIIGDSGFVMELSPLLATALEKSIKGWLTDFLSKHSLKLEDIRSWAVHPGGPRILSAVESALNLHKEELSASRHILRQFGNMSSCTVLFVLEEIAKREQKGPCLMLAFGPGVVCEAALLMI